MSIKDETNESNGQDELNIPLNDELEFLRVKDELGLSDQEVEDHKGDARAIWEKTYHKFKEANESEYSGRRWFWELVQNAIDSLDSLDNTVDVEVRINESDGIKTIEFSHNGGIFKNGEHIDDIDDFENFIRPGSSKPIGENEKGGRFGTGFLSTHCLSPKIKVSGICVTSEGKKYWNETVLDRSEITKEDSLSVRISKLKITKQLVDYKKNKRQTDFDVNNKPSACITYLSPIDEDSLNDGLQELEQSLPYVNAFNPQLESVKIIENENVKHYTNLRKTQDINGNSIYGTKLEMSGQLDTFKYIIRKEEDRFDLAWAVNLSENGALSFCDERIAYTDIFDDNKSSIFCRYPLVGSGDFKFPVILNSKEFRPEEKRNGINLKEENPTNKEILDLAIKAYKEFLIENNNTEHQFNIVDIFIKSGVDSLPSWVDKIWYREVLNNLKDTILKNAQIRVDSKNTVHLGQGKITYLSREDFKDEDRKKLHVLVKQLHPSITPIESEYILWFERIDFSDIPSLKYDHNNLLSDIEEFRTLKALSESIPDSITWLKNVISLILELDEDLLEKYAVIPNQQGYFKKRNNDLFYNDSIELRNEYEERGLLLNCHHLILDSEFEDFLLHEDFEEIQDILSKEKRKTEKELIRVIDDAIEEAEDRRSSKFVKALQLLFKWLDSHEDEELIKEFRFLSKNKPDLYFNTFTDYERDLAFTIAQSGKLDSLSKLAESSLTNDDINSIVSISNSGIDMNKMSELANLSMTAGIDKILETAKDLAREEEERIFKQKIGESVEEILNKLFEREFPYYKAELKREKEYDILIRNINKPINCYYIELKSIKEGNSDPIKMGIHQARMAKANPDNYALLFIRRPDSTITEQYFRDNVICDYQIGKDVIVEVDKSNLVDEIVQSMDSIKLEIKDPSMKVHINQGYVDGLGKDFEKLKLKIHEAIK